MKKIKKIFAILFSFIIFPITTSCEVPIPPKEITTGFFGEREYHDYDYYAEIYLMHDRFYLLCWEYNHTWESALVTGGISGVRAHPDDAYYCQKYYPCPFPIMKEILNERLESGTKPPFNGFPEVIITSYPATRDELNSGATSSGSDIELYKKIYEYFDLYWKYGSYE